MQHGWPCFLSCSLLRKKERRKKKAKRWAGETIFLPRQRTFLSLVSQLSICVATAYRKRIPLLVSPWQIPCLAWKRKEKNPACTEIRYSMAILQGIQAPIMCKFQTSPVTNDCLSKQTGSHDVLVSQHPPTSTATVPDRVDWPTTPTSDRE